LFREGIGESLDPTTPPAAPAPKGRSPRVVVALAVFVVLLLIAAGFILWSFLPSAGPRTTAPQYALDDPEFPSAAAPSASTSIGELTISLDHPGAAINPALFGFALEEINHSLDGGLYAELLRNRDLSQIYSEELVSGPDHQGIRESKIILIPSGWSLIKSGSTQAEMTADDPSYPRMATADGPSSRKMAAADSLAFPSNTAAKASLQLTISSIDPGQRAGIANEGYWGVPVKPDWQYHASFYARASNDFSGPLSLTIESTDGATTWARAAVDKITTSWQRYDVDLKTDKNITPSLKNQFVISAAAKGTLWLTEASLFPPTFNNRPNGNRIDIMEKLAALHPGFIIFPGGDTLLGGILRSRFNWKKTIGPVEMRSAQPSTWHRTSEGFGLMEFLLTCEYLHAEPVLAIYDGTSIRQSVQPGASLQPYIQDALDEIEYVTGDKSTPWGSRRAADGHPEPFNLQYVQIGNNEQMYNEATYDARFTQFHDAIKAKYPNLKLIGWMNLATTRTPDVIHESFYPTARQLMGDSHHYDGYPRDGPKYATEFNAKEGDPTKTLNAALADMSWMLGVERNADAVVLATAAPLLVNVNGDAAQHPANLIGYDSLSCVGSPSYYALRMFNDNKGDTIIPVKLTPPEADVSPQSGFHGAIGVGSWGTDVQYKDIKVTAPGGSILFQSDFSKSTDGWRFGSGDWKVDQGTLHQTSNVIDCTAIAGDPAWTDYTLTLKAKKNDGLEGFLILVHAADDGNFVWWNVAGWNGTSTGMQQTIDGGKVMLGDLVRNQIEYNRWYDIRVEVKGRDIVCYLDNAPILTATERPHPDTNGSVYASASRENKTGDLILKVVNALPQAALLNISIDGASTMQNTGTLQVMSGQPGDINTFNAPEKISPTHMNIHFPGTHFSHQFPPYSISVLRVNAK
jgi:alpha-L-arabinofuranosidase